MINRFAIVTDGFQAPLTYVGVDFATKIGRALVITDGYFPRGFSAGASRLVRWIFMGRRPAFLFRRHS